MAGESVLTDSSNFLYFLVVTSSTVGYGDFSPSTLAGKYVVSLFVIPVGLSIFAMVLTRFGIYISGITTRGRKGLRMLSLENHCVIIGWNSSRTLRLIDLILAKENGGKERVLLCVDVDIENPYPDKISFVKAESFSHTDTMARANLEKASRIIIDTPLDDVTLTTVLYCKKVSPNSHITAYFQDESVAALLLSHCPGVEIVPSVSVEMLARSSLDPGSASLHKQLLDSMEGMTQYSIECPSINGLSYGDIFKNLKFNLDATLVGLRHKEADKIMINPPLSTSVSSGDTLYYIAEVRLREHQCFEWAS